MRVLTAWFCAAALAGFLAGCAGAPPAPPSEDRQAQALTALLQRFARKEPAIQSFVSTGRLKASGNTLGSVLFLAAATRNPFRMKLELTHPWGRPLWHARFTDGAWELLDFREGRLWAGKTAEGADPGPLRVQLPLDQLWSVFRGYPCPVPTARPSRPTALRAEYRDAGGKPLQIIVALPDPATAWEVRLPPAGVTLNYSELCRVGEVPYARRVAVTLPEGLDGFEAAIEQIRFNPPIPEAVFELKPPPDRPDGPPA